MESDHIEPLQGSFLHLSITTLLLVCINWYYIYLCKPIIIIKKETKNMIKGSNNSAIFLGQSLVVLIKLSSILSVLLFLTGE